MEQTQHQHIQTSSLEAFKSALAVARRRWGASPPRTQPRRNLRQTTDNYEYYNHAT